MGEKEKKETKPEVKKFKAKSMCDGDLRMPSALRKKITWLGNHTDVVFEIISEGEGYIGLIIRKAKNTK